MTDDTPIVHGSQRGPATRRVPLTIPTTLLEEVDALRGGRGRSEIVRLALREWVRAEREET